MPFRSSQTSNQMKTAIQHRIGRRPYEDDARNQLAKRQRGIGESPGAYAADLRTYARRGHVSLSEKVQEELAVQDFIRSVQPEHLREHLRLHVPDTLAAALAEAQHVKHVLYSEGRVRSARESDVDILAAFPITDQGKRYLLVAMGYFTKWQEACAVFDQSALTTAERLVEEMFCRFGVPEELHSDQGRHFEAKVLQEVCRRLGVKKTRTTSLHPQSNGLAERFNGTLSTQLAILTDSRQRDWDHHQPLVLWSCWPRAADSGGLGVWFTTRTRGQRRTGDGLLSQPP